jgi:Metal-dependent hydrolase involved in phosphonate metabolism
MTENIVLTNGVVITPDEVFQDGTVIVEGGIVSDVLNHLVKCDGKESQVVDVGGRFILPGLIDLHNDGLEREMKPRPGAKFSPRWTLVNYDRRLITSGITTEFHGIYFADLGGVRSVEGAVHSAR